MPAANQTISLTEAAERLGVHYMTVYKYVRTGRLPAHKDGVSWRVSPSDVDALSREPSAPARDGSPRRRALPRLRDRLVAGDEAGAWAVVEGALASGAEPADIYVELLVPAMRWVGDRWADGSLSVADEHRAAAVAQRLVGRLGPRFRRRGRRRGTVVVGAPSGELHGLPVSILADLLRAAGYEVVDLGPNTPPESFVEAAEGATRLIAVALCISTDEGARGLRAALRALRAAGVEAPLLAGGAAVDGDAHARRLGADGYTGPDARDAVEAVQVTGRSQPGR